MSKVTVNVCIQRMGEAKRAIDELQRIKAACEKDKSLAISLQALMSEDPNITRTSERTVEQRLDSMIARLEDYTEVLRNVLDRTPVEWPPFSENLAPLLE